jgi:LPS sulfotransferase NodH
LSDTPSDYGFGARLLHRLALGSRAIAETSFDIESATQNADTASLTGFERPVFISGLARAGTTILMRALWDTGAFRSLTYRDMPFVLMPSLWRKLSGRSRLASAEKERAHGDRVMVGFDSPEAFEEVFWRLFCGDDYIRGDRLVPHDYDEETLQAFRRFVAHALQSSENPAALRYLSKNNNDILRFGAIARAFPQAVILVPHRDPLQQAISLMRQHEHFLTRHAEDRFSRQYMDWLGHHEFGSGHKRFDFGLDIPEAKAFRDSGSINYWLAEWVEAYAYLLENDFPAARFVSYETLCADGPGMLKAVLETCGVDAPLPDVTLEAPPDREADDVDPDLLARAREIAAKLSASRRAIRVQ